MHGVILDAGSFDQNDLITSSLENSLESWHWHRSTLPNQTMARIADMNVIVTNKVAINTRTICFMCASQSALINGDNAILSTS